MKIAVANKTDKQNRYQEVIEKFNQAKESGFYFEALWILYGIFEDRSDDIYVILEIATYSANGKLLPIENRVPDLRKILHLPNAKTDGWFSTLYEKLLKLENLVTRLLNERIDKDNDSEYAQELFEKVNRLEKAKKQATIDILKHLNNLSKDDWRSKRNKLMHSLVQVGTNINNRELKLLVDEGELLFRELDLVIEIIRGKPDNVALCEKRLTSVKERNG